MLPLSFFLHPFLTLTHVNEDLISCFPFIRLFCFVGFFLLIFYFYKFFPLFFPNPILVNAVCSKILEDEIAVHVSSVHYERSRLFLTLVYGK